MRDSQAQECLMSNRTHQTMTKIDIGAGHICSMRRLGLMEPIDGDPTYEKEQMENYNSGQHRIPKNMNSTDAYPSFDPSNRIGPTRPSQRIIRNNPSQNSPRLEESTGNQRPGA